MGQGFDDISLVRDYMEDKTPHNPVDNISIVTKVIVSVGDVDFNVYVNQDGDRIEWEVVKRNTGLILQSEEIADTVPISAYLWQEVIKAGY